MQKSLTKADSAGFCFGVSRAVKMVNDLLDEGKRVCTLGPIIHNMQMVEELRQKGCRPIERVEELGGDEILVIRSHGVPKSVIDDLQQRGLPFADATCPFVKKIHRLVAGADPEHDIMLIAGNRDHPEVQGIVGNCRCEYYTFNCEAELDEILPIVLEKKNKQVKMVAQTTFDTKELKKSVKKLKKLCTNAKIFDTICNATSVRQSEAVK